MGVGGSWVLAAPSSSSDRMSPHLLAELMLLPGPGLCVGRMWGLEAPGLAGAW